MLTVEPCFEATFFDEASTTKPAVNAIELSAAWTDRTTEPSQVQPAITRSASIRQARYEDRRPQRDETADSAQCEQKNSREQANMLDRCEVPVRRAGQLSLCR
jgi:hypothetical protein